jgi:hypothetical protein
MIQKYKLKIAYPDGVFPPLQYESLGSEGQAGGYFFVNVINARGQLVTLVLQDNIAYFQAAVFRNEAFILPLDGSPSDLGYNAGNATAIINHFKSKYTELSDMTLSAWANGVYHFETDGSGALFTAGHTGSIPTFDTGLGGDPFQLIIVKYSDSGVFRFTMKTPFIPLEQVENTAGETLNIDGQPKQFRKLDEEMIKAGNQLNPLIDYSEIEIQPCSFYMSDEPTASTLLYYLEKLNS